MANVVQALIRIAGEPTGAVQALKTVQREAQATGAATVRVTEQINRASEATLNGLKAHAASAEAEIAKLSAGPRTKAGNLPANITKSIIQWQKELERTLKEIDVAENGVINTSYKMGQGLAQAGKQAQSAFVPAKAAIQNFAQAGLNVVKAGTQMKNAVTQVGTALKLAPFVGVSNNIKNMAAAAKPAAAAFISLAAAGVRTAQGFVNLTKAAASMLPHLASMASKALSAGKALMGMGKSLGGTAFTSTGTHIAGLAVRLGQIQTGMYGIGMAATQLKTKIVGAFGPMLEQAGNFQDSVVTLNAVLGHAVPQETKDGLRELALQIGRDLPVSSQQAIDSINELVKAGVKVGAIMNGAATATVALSVATGTDLTKAAQIVSQTINTFSGQQIDANKAVDQLTRVANASAVTVEQLGDTMKNAGAAANMMGASFEDFTILAGALGNIGIKGGEAGTALRYFYMNLIPNTQKTIKLYQEEGLMKFHNAEITKKLDAAGEHYTHTQEGMLEGLWNVVGGARELGKTYAQAVQDGEPAVGKFQSYLVRQGLLTSKFIDDTTGKVKSTREIFKQMFETFGQDSPAVLAEKIGQMFGQRGGFKGAAPLIKAYQEYDVQLQKLKKSLDSGAISQAAFNKQSEALNLDKGNLIDQLTGDIEKYGGATEIMNERIKTWKGSNEQLSSSIEVLKINAVTPLLDALSPLVMKVKEFVDRVSIWARNNPELMKSIGIFVGLAAAAAAVVGPLATMGAVLPFLIQGFRVAAIAMAPMGLILLALGAVIGAVVFILKDPTYGLGGALKGVGDAFQGFLPAAMKFFATVINTVVLPIAFALADVFVRYMLPALKGVGDWFAGAGKSALGGFAGFVQTVVVPAIYQIAQFLSVAIPVAIQLLGAAWQNILMPAFNAVVQLWQTTLEPVFMALVDTLGKILPPILSFLADLWVNLLAPALQSVGQILVTVIFPAVVQVVNILSAVLGPVLKFIGWLWGEYLGPMITKAADGVGKFVAFVGPIIQWLAEHVIVGILLPAFEGIWKVLGPVLSFMMDGIGQAFKAIGDACGWLKDRWNENFLGIRDIVTSIWNFISGIFKFIGDALSWLGTTIHDAWVTITGQSKEDAFTAGDETGRAYYRGLGKPMNQAVTDAAKSVVSIAKNLGMLEGPAGLKGYNSGFNFSFGILDGLNTNIPQINAMLARISIAIGDTITQLNEVDKATGGDGSVGERLDKRFGQLYNRRKQLETMGGGLYDPSGFQTSDTGITPYSPDGDTPFNGGGPLEGQQPSGGSGGGGKNGSGGTTRTPAEQAADVAKKVADAIKDGIAALRQIATLSVPTNLEAKAKEFSDALTVLVMYLQKASTNFEDKALVHTEAFLDAANKSVDTLSKGLDGFAKLKDFEAPAATAIDSFVASVKHLVGQTEIASRDFSVDALVQTQLFAETGEKATSMLEKGLSAFAQVGKFVKPAEDKIRGVVDAVKFLMLRVAEIADVLSPEKEAQASELSDSAAKVADAIGKVADVVNKLNDPKLNVSPVTDKIRTLANEMLAMMNILGDLWTKNPGWTPENAEKVAALGDSSAKVAGGLLAVFDMMQALQADAGKTHVPLLAERVKELADAMFAMMNQLAPLSAQWEGFTEIPAKFAEDGGKTAAGISAMIDMFVKLDAKDSRKVQFKNLADRVTELANALNQMVSEFARVAGGQDISALGPYAETAAKLASTLGSTLELLDKTSQFKAGKSDPKAVVQAVLGFMVDFVKEYDKVKGQLGSVDEDSAALAGRVGSAISGLGGTLDVFDKMTSFHKVGPAKIKEFIVALTDMVEEMKTLPNLGDDMLTTMEDFGSKLGPAFDLMASALSLFMTMMGEDETSDTDKGTKTTHKGGFKAPDVGLVHEFIASLKLLVVTLRDGLLNDIAPEMLDLAQAFGEKMGPALDTLDKALGIFIKLVPDSEGKGGLKTIDPNAIGALVGDLYLLLHHWHNLIIGGEFQGDFGERSAAFTAMLEPVLTDMERVLALADGIAKANADNGAIDKMPESIHKMMVAIGSLVGIALPDIAGNFDGMFTDLSTEFATQARGDNPDSMMYKWAAKDEHKSILWKMWTAVSGKGGFRWEIPLAFQGMFTDLSAKFQAWHDEIVPFWSSVMSELTSLTTTAIDTIKAALDGIVNGSITVTVNFSGGIPALAAGGIATGKGPTLAMIGDGKEPEMVVPLSKAKQYGFGGGANSTTNNYFNVRQANVNSVSDLASQNRRLRSIQGNMS